jgi:CxxC motif-containing protein (DUF1111 family)
MRTRLARSSKYLPSVVPLRRSVAIAGTLLVSAAALLVAARGGMAGGTPDQQRGAALFRQTFTITQGLGPLFNKAACQDCHNTPAVGGGGPNGLSTVLRVGRLTNGDYDPMSGHGGPVARAHSISENGAGCALQAGVPPGANVTSVRNAPPLFGSGQIDAIPDAAIVDQEGRANMVDGRVGRFGWKADTSRLRDFVGDAFRNELGLTNPLAPSDLVEGCGADRLDLDSSAIDAVTEFIAALPEPQPTATGDATVFAAIGCASCHVPSLAGVPLYSDLLLHDMGRALDDGVRQGQARGQDWRTTPLWGLRARARFLHDGRARTIEAAILAHSGEAEPVVARFRAVSTTDRQALLSFLATL